MNKEQEPLDYIEHVFIYPEGSEDGEYTPMSFSRRKQESPFNGGDLRKLIVDCFNKGVFDHLEGQNIDISANSSGLLEEEEVEEWIESSVAAIRPIPIEFSLEDECPLFCACDDCDERSCFSLSITKEDWPREVWKLYWATSEDHDEDWFVIARSAHEAAIFHAAYEGYDYLDTEAELITVTTNPEGEVRHGQPEDIERVGGHMVILSETVTPFEENLRYLLGCGARAAKIGDRIFVEGDLVTNTSRRVKEELA